MYKYKNKFINNKKLNIKKCSSILKKKNNNNIIIK